MVLLIYINKYKFYFAFKDMNKDIIFCIKIYFINTSKYNLIHYNTGSNFFSPPLPPSSFHPHYLPSICMDKHSFILKHYLPIAMQEIP